MMENENPHSTARMSQFLWRTFAISICKWSPVTWLKMLAIVIIFTNFKEHVTWIKTIQQKPVASHWLWALPPWLLMKIWEAKRNAWNGCALVAYALKNPLGAMAVQRSVDRGVVLSMYLGVSLWSPRIIMINQWNIGGFGARWNIRMPLRIPIPFISGCQISKPPTQNTNLPIGWVKMSSDSDLKMTFC